MANPEFGTIVTSGGAAFTWAGNSRENRLTPFANDPITDPTGEAIYLRDDRTRHGMGRHAGPAGAERRTRIAGSSGMRPASRGTSTP